MAGSPAGTAKQLQQACMGQHLHRGHSGGCQGGAGRGGEPHQGGWGGCHQGWGGSCDCSWGWHRNAEVAGDQQGAEGGRCNGWQWGGCGGCLDQAGVQVSGVRWGEIGLGACRLLKGAAVVDKARVCRCQPMEESTKHGDVFGK